MLAPPLGSWRPLLGEIVDPPLARDVFGKKWSKEYVGPATVRVDAPIPLGNPGSATVYGCNQSISGPVQSGLPSCFTRLVKP